MDQNREETGTSRTLSSFEDPYYVDAPLCQFHSLQMIKSIKKYVM
jgi:hypothetical protein